MGGHAIIESTYLLGWTEKPALRNTVTPSKFGNEIVCGETEYFEEENTPSKFIINSAFMRFL
jgi:hypothetical protein